jgi:hypothetical protein
VVGIGLYTNGDNRRAVAALWKAGPDSMMNDVRFLGGHGTPLPDGSRQNPYNSNHTGDPDPHRRWDSQYPSLCGLVYLANAYCLETPVFMRFKFDF